MFPEDPVVVECSPEWHLLRWICIVWQNDLFLYIYCKFCLAPDIVPTGLLKSFILCKFYSKFYIVRIYQCCFLTSCHRDYVHPEVETCSHPYFGRSLPVQFYLGRSAVTVGSSLLSNVDLILETPFMSYRVIQRLFGRFFFS